MSSSSSHSGSPADASGGGGPLATPGDIAVGVVVGRLSEFFDFFVYGLASVLVFPAVFFPFASPQDGLLYSFIVFSFGFIARPLGTLLFRQIHNRYGRGTKLTAALFLLGTATVSMAFLPGYAVLGSTSIVLLAVLRVVQGAAVGGSWDGLPSLLALSAPAGRRGWYAMIAQLGAPLGFMMAAGLFAYLVASLSVADFNDWGWRYPFFVAFAVNVVALFARLRLVATPNMTEAMKKRELRPSPLPELFRLQSRNIVLGALAPLASYALFNVLTVFPPSWVMLYQHSSLVDFLLVQILGATIGILTMLVSGVVADRIGRPRTLEIGALMIAVFGALAPVILDGSVEGGYVYILIGFALLGFSHAQAAGAVNSAFPPRFRYSGAVYTSDLGWLLGAGFAPLIALLLTTRFGLAAVGWYVLAGAIGTLVTLRVTWLSRKASARQRSD
ncbi:MAG: MFS transporter [Panacagrimonas sp.]